MLGILLNIVGLIVVIISLFLINKVSQQEKEMYEEIKFIYDGIKDYSFTIDNTFTSFHDLIEASLNKMENYNNKPIGEDDKQSKKITINYEGEAGDSDKNLYKEIIYLKNVGLSSEEIAKKLNKGVREIEIIIKMWGNIKL